MSSCRTRWAVAVCEILPSTLQASTVLAIDGLAGKYIHGNPKRSPGTFRESRLSRYQKPMASQAATLMDALDETATGLGAGIHDISN